MQIHSHMYVSDTCSPLDQLRYTTGSHNTLIGSTDNTVC